MKVNINKDRCIGCGACVASVPEVFDFDDDGLAKSVVEVVPAEKEEEVVSAQEMCPGSAITAE